jgi:hypothetical protein
MTRLAAMNVKDAATLSCIINYRFMLENQHILHMIQDALAGNRVVSDPISVVESMSLRNA